MRRTFVCVRLGGDLERRTLFAARERDLVGVLAARFRRSASTVLQAAAAAAWGGQPARISPAALVVPTGLAVPSDPAETLIWAEGVAPREAFDEAALRRANVLRTVGVHGPVTPDGLFAHAGLGSEPDDVQRDVALLVRAGLVVEDDGWGYVVPDEAETRAKREYARLLGLRSCRVCGCTDDWACDGGCAWAAPDLCDRHEATAVRP